MVSKVKKAFKRNPLVGRTKKEVSKKITSSDSKKASKKVTKATSKSKIAPPTYKSMIVEGILVLKERNGSSRQALKKYILGKYPVGETFDSRFNLAIRKGIDAGDFTQPKGPSGPVKVVKTKIIVKPEEVIDTKKKVPTVKVKVERATSKKPSTKSLKAKSGKKSETGPKEDLKKVSSKGSKGKSAAATKKTSGKTGGKILSKKVTPKTNTKKVKKANK